MKKFKAEERAEIEKSGQTISPKVFYMKQLIGNACGTVAVMHALGNNQSVLAPGADTIIARFWEQTKSMDHMARGQALADSHELASAHHVVAKEGQTDAPEADANVNYHFISFVQVDGSIYELDGGKQFPINHGPSSADTFIADAVKVIKTNFVEKLGQDFNFSVVTLGPAVDE
jgi:ubiquitin carboxyl-terminal hydrolase L3